MYGGPKTSSVSSAKHSVCARVCVHAGMCVRLREHKHEECL